MSGRPDGAVSSTRHGWEIQRGVKGHVDVVGEEVQGHMGQYLDDVLVVKAHFAQGQQVGL